jgi:hypothetical protein
MVIITKTEELFTGELRAIIGDDGVWDPEAMNYVGKKKSTTCSDLIFMIDRASIHFENLLMATSKWVKPPSAFWSGPTRSRPPTAKGHVIGIVWSAWAGR